MLKVALGQFAVSRVWEENAQVCEDLMRRARGRAPADPAGRHPGPRHHRPADRAQGGPAAGRPLRVPPARRQPGSRLATLFCVHVPTGDGRVWNTLVTLRDGEIISEYRKLHLYDAFNMKESTNVTPATGSRRCWRSTA